MGLAVKVVPFHLKILEMWLHLYQTYEVPLQIIIKQNVQYMKTDREKETYFEYMSTQNSDLSLFNIK